MFIKKKRKNAIKNKWAKDLNVEFSNDQEAYKKYLGLTNIRKMNIMYILSSPKLQRLATPSVG